MFAREKFRMIERRRAVAATRLAAANDNRRAERHALATPGRTALVGRWRTNEQTGRLEWHWSLELVADEPPSSGRPADARTSACIINNTSMEPHDRRLAILAQNPNNIDGARGLGHLGVIQAEH